MKFTLELALKCGDQTLDAASLLKQIDAHREVLRDIGALEGRIVIRFDGREPCEPYVDPVVRLCDQWLRKLPWIIGGDTETVALRNSEECFAFVPAGESVEISYFTGTESEIEEYLIEPTTVRLDAFVAELIKLGDALLAILKGVDPALVANNEDCRDFSVSLGEAKRAWREHQLHQRR